MSGVMHGGSASRPSGPPYPGMYAALGGLPTNNVDTPLAAVFLVLYITCAASHMTIFQLNNRRGHKFILSGLMFGYCMSRIVTLSLRISWANFPRNVRLAIAANIFTAAGVLILYIVNLIFSQRIIRATHPTWGWSKAFSNSFKVLYALIPLMLIMVITAVVQQRYTLNEHTMRIDQDLTLTGQCYLLFVVFLPLPLMAINYAIPTRTGWDVEEFGRGHWAIKTVALVVASSLLTLGAGFRVGIGFEDYYHPRPLTNPGWYHSKACYWIFDIVVELAVVYLYLLLRVDLRFHVPNGAHGPGSYSKKNNDVKGETDVEKVDSTGSTPPEETTTTAKVHE